MSSPARRTPLHSAHEAAGARLVSFAGWEMPLHYGSQIEEHHAVRRDAGMFDVSHMLALDLSGAQSTPFLRWLLANDVAKLKPTGKALYSCMLNDEGGVLDDLIVYRISGGEYRIVVNAATAEKDVAWIRRRIAATGANLTLEGRRNLALIAVQGPNAIERAARAIPEINTSRGIPPPFNAARLGDLLIARTGYTGEDGFEIAVPAGRATAVWDALLAAGVRPCGLGARDTLRLEAGLNLYGQDMDESVTPLDAGLAWTVDFSDEDRDFVGKSALLTRPAGHAMLGLVLDDKGVLRAGMKIHAGAGDGVITSGSFSPTLGKSIALARLPRGSAPGAAVEVDVRGKRLHATTVKPPFVRNGRILV